MTSSTNRPDQGDPAAHPPYLWAWRISHLTWSGTVDEETATSRPAEYGQAPVPLYRTPGAVASADQGDPAAWTHPDEEEETNVRRALACAHSPEEAVSGWPTVAGVLAVEVERLRALVRAPGAVAAAPPGAWGVLADVREERRRQDAQWGLNDHDDGAGPQDFPLAAVWQCLAVPVRGGGVYASELAAAARRVVRENDNPSWWSILFEEVAEASAEATVAGLRARLVKAAAVAVAWIESIDRRVDASFRAPGAVAAAPPGDEGDAWGAMHEVLALWDVGGAFRSEIADDLAAAAKRLVPPAPPTRHDDDAAVERAISDDVRVVTRALGLYQPEAGAALDRIAAFAAARGPRVGEVR